MDAAGTATIGVLLSHPPYKALCLAGDIESANTGPLSSDSQLGKPQAEHASYDPECEGPGIKYILMPTPILIYVEKYMLSCHFIFRDLFPVVIKI